MTDTTELEVRMEAFMRAPLEAPAGAPAFRPGGRGRSSVPCCRDRPETSAETTGAATGLRAASAPSSGRGLAPFRGGSNHLVKVSGQGVEPLEVVRRVAERPHVHECAVVAEPPANRAWPCAPWSGRADDEARIAGLGEHARRALQPHHAPRTFDRADALCDEETGRIDRRERSTMTQAVETPVRRALRALIDRPHVTALRSVPDDLVRPAPRSGGVPLGGRLKEKRAAAMESGLYRERRGDA